MHLYTPHMRAHTHTYTQRGWGDKISLETEDEKSRKQGVMEMSSMWSHLSLCLLAPPRTQDPLTSQWGK